jgi:hypothetical protein
MELNIHWIYLLGLIIITIVTLYAYVFSTQTHLDQIKKIEILEEKIKDKKNKLDEIRIKTTPCNYDNLNDPRSCYFESNHKCSWNEEAERCDKI